MVFFIILTFFLALLVLIQQGKGDMGLGSMGGGSQLLFGGSGGQSFFEKMTWFLGALFILGALGLSLLKSRQTRQSTLEGFVVEKRIATQQAEEATAAQTPSAPAPVTNAAPNTTN